MSSLLTNERKAKFNKLSNDLNLNNREHPIDLSIKNKQIVYCSYLPSGTLLQSSYVDIESTNIISSDALTREYKLLGTKPKEIVDNSKILKENAKSIFDNMKNKLL